MNVIIMTQRYHFSCSITELTSLIHESQYLPQKVVGMKWSKGFKALSPQVIAIIIIHTFK